MLILSHYDDEFVGYFKLALRKLGLTIESLPVTKPQTLKIKLIDKPYYIARFVDEMKLVKQEIERKVPFDNKTNKLKNIIIDDLSTLIRVIEEADFNPFEVKIFTLLLLSIARQCDLKEFFGVDANLLKSKLNRTDIMVIDSKLLVKSKIIQQRVPKVAVPKHILTSLNIKFDENNFTDDVKYVDVPESLNFDYIDHQFCLNGKVPEFIMIQYLDLNFDDEFVLDIILDSIFDPNLELI